MANTGFKGVNVRQTGNELVFRAFLQNSSGALVTTGTTNIYLIEMQSDGTIKTYDFNDNTFKSTACTTENLAMTYRKSNNAATDTGLWTAPLSTLTGFTAGGIYLARVNNSGAYPTDQMREFQYGGAEGDLVTTANGTGVAELNVDLKAIDGNLTNGNNATLNLKQLNVVNSAGDAIVASSTGSNGNGINASGNGTADGIHAVGGATGRGGHFLGGATSGAGIRCEGQGGNSLGIHGLGIGTGPGMQFEGGTTGPGAKFIGGATSGDGIDITTTSGDGLSILPTAGNGIVATANGASKHGMSITGGTSGTCHGVKIVSGSSGDGLNVTSTSSATNGASFAGVTSGAGILCTGGTTGDGLKAVGGTGSTQGGAGINAVGGAATTTTPAGSGIKATGGVSTTSAGGTAGVGLQVVGGAGSASTNGAASGASFTGGGTNTVNSSAHGISATGTSQGCGMVLTGGGVSAADGLQCVAGTGGVDIRGNITGNVTGNLSGSAGSVTARVTANTDQFAGQTITCAGPVTIPSATLASTTNITAGTITTTTNLTNLPSIPANWLTAAGIAAGALNGKGDWLLASSYTAPPTTAAIATAIWEDTTAGGDFGTAGSIGLLLVTDIDAKISSRLATSGYTTPPTTAQIATGVWQDATAGDFTTASSIGKSLYTSGAVPGAAGGLFIAGTNAATTVNFTGNLSGSVGSVTAGVTVTTNNDKTGYSLTVAPPTAAQIATTVWQDTTASSDFSTAGSIGLLLKTDIDSAISTRLATSGYTTPPTAASIATTVWQDLTAGSDFGTTGSIGLLLKTDIDAAISSRSTYAGGAVASVTGNVGGNVVGSVGSMADAGASITSAALAATGLNSVLVAGVTLPNAVRYIGATVAGTIADSQTATEDYHDWLGALAVSISVDSTGNRSAVTLH